MNLIENVFEFEYENSLIKFIADDNDWIPNLIKQKNNFYEVDLLECIRKYLNPSELVLDIGANIGNHSVYFSKICGCKVLAFEAVHENYVKLKNNIALNELSDQVHCFNFGLGAKEFKAKFSQPSSENSGSFKLQEIDSDGDIIIKQLDGLDIVDNNKKIKFIKIDVEGMEYDVLKGSLKTIESHLPILSIEIKTNKEFYNIYDFLLPLKYSVIGVFNATPTFLFASEENGASIDVLRQTIRSLGVYYIDVKRRLEK